MTTVIRTMTLVVLNRRIQAMVAVVAAVAAGVMVGSGEAAAGFKYMP